MCAFLLLLLFPSCLVQMNVTLTTTLYRNTSQPLCNTKPESQKRKVKSHITDRIATEIREVKPQHETDESKRSHTYPSMVCLVGGGAHRKLGDHFRVMGDFRGWTHHRRTDIACTAALDDMSYKHRE